MAIKRVINGVEVEIELTPEEVQEVYNAEHYAEGGEWFGKVRWCNEDLEKALDENGHPATDHNVQALRQKCEHHSFYEYMIEAGWGWIASAISIIEDEDGFDPDEGDKDEDGDDCEWGATEPCPHCEVENFYPKWDVEQQGYVAICQECGEEIFLCDACMHADDNPGHNCDWQETACGGACFRGKTTSAEHKANLTTP